MITSTSRPHSPSSGPALGFCILSMTCATREESGEGIRARKSRAVLVLDPPMSSQHTPSSRSFLTCRTIATGQVLVQV
jgi:hypothetical protein